MLTISVSESLSMGPAAWSAWHADAGTMMHQLGEACAQWSADGFQPHPDLMDWSQKAAAESAIWDYSTPALGPWQIPTDSFGTEPSQYSPHNTSATWGINTPPQRLVSPLMVPLPEPLQAGVFEMSLDGLGDLEESQMIQPPPGLAGVFEMSLNGLDDLEEPQTIQPPPGLLASADPLKSELSVSSAMSAALAPLADYAPPGVSIISTSVEGRPCIRVEWLIQDLTSKLQACMGRPFVSPPFTACGMENLRFMVFPDARDSMKSARSRERKGLYEKMIKKGPLYGSLKLKADCLEQATMLTFNLTVGVVRAGPLTYDFSEQAIHGLNDFGVDWLKQVEKGTGNLRLGIEILEVRLKGENAK